MYHIDEGKRWRVGNIYVHINGENPHTKIQTALNRLSIRSGRNRRHPRNPRERAAASGQRPVHDRSGPRRDAEDHVPHSGSRRHRNGQRRRLWLPRPKSGWIAARTRSERQRHSASRPRQACQKLHRILTMARRSLPRLDLLWCTRRHRRRCHGKPSRFSNRRRARRATTCSTSTSTSTTIPSSWTIERRVPRRIPRQRNRPRRHPLRSVTKLVAFQSKRPRSRHNKLPRPQPGRTNRRIRPLRLQQAPIRRPRDQPIKRLKPLRPRSAEQLSALRCPHAKPVSAGDRTELLATCATARRVLSTGATTTPTGATAQPQTQSNRYAAARVWRPNRRRDRAQRCCRRCHVVPSAPGGNHRTANSAARSKLCRRRRACPQYAPAPGPVLNGRTGLRSADGRRL